MWERKIIHNIKKYINNKYININKLHESET